MSRTSVQQLFLVAAACLGVAGCATAPTEERARIIDMPLASTYADFAFTVTTASRLDAVCDNDARCPAPADRDAALRFAQQVQRVAGVLQSGARALYPDLAQPIPGPVARRFDVYVVEDHEPGSDSSADGRIVLTSALGARQPYDDWLAFVIAREMGHVIARHHEENSAASIATSVIMNIVLPGSSLLKSVLSAGGSGIAARSKRDVQEREADVIALGLLKASAYRLRDVSLSLAVAPSFPDSSLWSKNFRKSSDNLLAVVRKSEATVALASPLESGGALLPEAQDAPDGVVRTQEWPLATKVSVSFVRPSLSQ